MLTHSIVYKVFQLLLCSRSVVSDSFWPRGLQHAGSLLKLMSVELAMPSNHLILCHPLLLLSSVFPSIRVFSNELFLHIRSPKYYNFSFSISPPNEYSALISFRIDGFDLLAAKGRLRVFSNTTVQKHQFFGAQLSLYCIIHTHTWLLGKPYPWLDGPLLAK